MGRAAPAPADYDILAKGPQPIIIDGSCDEPSWSYAAADNTVDCRFLWEDGGPDRVYGCCTVGDDQLEALQTIHDADDCEIAAVSN